MPKLSFALLLGCALLLLCAGSLPRAQGDPALADRIILDDADGGLDDENEETFSRLIETLDTGTLEQRQSAIWEARIQTQSLRVLTKLDGVLQKGSPELALTAAVTLGEIRRKEAVPGLLKALEAKSTAVQEAAAYALGFIGDPTAIAPLQAHQPKAPGLARWIYQDALDRLAGRPSTPMTRRTTLHGAGIYFIGAKAEDELRDEWRAFIAQYDLRLDTAPPGDINPVMGHFGGAPNTNEFFARLQDLDGKPQVDIVCLCGVLPFEFSIELQWRLVQFVRRGGVLITLGNSMFLTGELKKANGESHRKFAPANSFWIANMPPTLDDTFRPCVAGFKGALRKTLRSGERTVGQGKILTLAEASPTRLPIRQLFGLGCSDNWQLGKGFWQFPTSNYTTLFRYALEGEAAFPVLLDLVEGPAKVKGAGPALFRCQVLSAAREAGTLTCELLAGETVMATQLIPIDMRSGTHRALNPAFTLPVSLPDGKYTVRLTYATPHGTSADVWPLELTSPLRLHWTFTNSYREAGQQLVGQATVTSDLTMPLPGIALSLSVHDGEGRTLQRLVRQVELSPGANAPVPLALPARDLPIGAYGLSVALVQDGRILQRGSGVLLRDGPYRFQQDLVYAPWGQFNPGDPRQVRAFKEAGLNAGGMRAHPGWYAWGVCGPEYAPLPTWPGDWVAQLTGYYPFRHTSSAYASVLHERLTNATVIHHWDETEITIVESVRGDVAPVTSVLYRNWLKSRYFSLAGLNATWGKEYKIFGNPSKQIPAAREWDGDLTSWNQVWPYRGAPRDWGFYANNLWGDLAYQCRNEFRKVDRDEHPWLWYDTFHTRLYPSTRPNETNYQAHENRAALGDHPSSLMLHFIAHTPTLPGIARMTHLDGLAGGGRHFIIYRADDAPDPKDPAPIWKPGYELKPHGKELAESIHAIRAKEQVFLDTRNVLSKEVAFLYHGTSGWPPGNGTPKALFDALVFGGIHPESLSTSALRSQRMPLSSFKVIVRCGKGDLPPAWQTRIAEWQKGGGVYLNATDFPFTYRGGGKAIKIDEFTFTSDTLERIGTPGFTAYQAKILALLKGHGVTPPFQVVDDNGLPEPALYPVLMRTQDQSQAYLAAVGDWDHWASQAFGAPAMHASPGKIDLTGGWTEGAKFTTVEPTRLYRLWAEVKLTGPFQAKVTVDGKGGVPFPMETDPPNDHLWAERGSGQTRWVAGPEFRLKAGEHLLQISAPVGGTITRVLLTEETRIYPTLKCALPNVKAVYDVYHDRQLTRSGDGWVVSMGLSECTVLSLLTEELGEVQLEPRLLPDDSGRRLQVKIAVRRRDGALSACRHAVNVTVKDATGLAIPGLFTKASVNGWGVVQLFPALEAAPLPWTVEVKDLTSGQSARSPVTALAAQPFEALAPLPAIEFSTEPLPPLEGDVHLVPFRVTVRNNGATALQGQLRVELPPAVLLEGTPELPVSVAPHTATTCTWTAVLGRAQAITLLDAPPRAWLTLNEGQTREVQFNDVWVRRWEATPPLVTNLKAGEITVRLLNFTGRPVVAKLATDLSDNWRIDRLPDGNLIMPAAKGETAGEIAVRYTALLKADAPQAPEVKRLPLRLTVGERTFSGGVKLVETEKRRRWQMAAGDQVLDEFGKAADPDIPDEPVTPAKERLWDVAWKPVTTDTLIDFPLPSFPAYYAVTNVRFPKAGEVSVRVRGEAKVQVWLAGRPLEARERIAVPANTWLPLVISYKTSSKIPLSNDLVFLDGDGKVLWDAECDVEMGQ
jgi:hypothetical protein